MKYGRNLFLACLVMPVLAGASARESDRVGRGQRVVSWSNAEQSTHWRHNPYSGERVAAPSGFSAVSFLRENCAGYCLEGNKALAEELRQRLVSQVPRAVDLPKIYSDLRSIIREFGRPRSEEDKRQKETELIEYVQSAVSMEFWNTHNPNTGQALVHEMIPLAWNIELLQRLTSMGMRLDLATKAPDRFVGSTLLHGVAGGLASKRRHCDTRNGMAWQSDSDVIKYRNSFVWLCKQCPDALSMRARDTVKIRSGYKDPLNLLLDQDRAELLRMVQDEKH